MATRGRPRATRNVYSFEDPTLIAPAEVVVDTSFVVHALIPRQPLHAQCQAFLAHLSGSDCTLFFNRLLEVELAESVFKIAVKEQHGGRAWPSKRFDGRVRRRAARILEETTEAWSTVLEAMNWGRIELEEVVELVPDLMKTFGLSSNDAVHAATVSYTGTSILVTTDSDFAVVADDQLTLLTSSSLVASCRRKRGG